MPGMSKVGGAGISLVLPVRCAGPYAIEQHLRVAKGTTAWPLPGAPSLVKQKAEPGMNLTPWQSRFPYLRSSLSACLLLASLASSGAPPELQRPAFVQAEQAIKQGRLAEAEKLMSDLGDYPLYPYLLYQKLVREPDNAQAVRGFLSRYGQTRQAVLLRQRWLERLAEQEDWGEFVQYYRETDNINLQCLHSLALASLGRREEAFAGAERVWVTGNSLPASCDRLFDLWRTDSSFTVEHIWKRYALAMRKGNSALAASLEDLLPPPLRAQADFWRQVHDNPRLVLSCSLWDPKAPVAGRIFAHGIDRLTATEPLLAQTAWALHKNRFSIDAEETARIDRRTALGLAAQRYDQAGAYLLDLPRESTDALVRSWRVRAALARKDWPGALATIELLPAEEKNQSQWRYWRGRALEALGDRQEALENYRLAASARDFYGFNAADRMGGEYAFDFQTPMHPTTEAELNQLANAPPFLVISELRALNRDTEARREWMHAIKSLSSHDLVVAAKLAQRWGLDNLAIATAAKAGYRDDLSLGFPLGYYPSVLQAAQSQQIDPTMIYGLIRQESAFDPNAGSSAGALGLMQLMPATGEMVARRFNEAPPSVYALLEPERNVRYGAAYLRGLLERFSNHFALAAAAYNAGPGRVERWLPANGSLPADLWVETIPFSETRQYVAAVLSHAVIYQARLNQSLRKIAAYMPDVPAGAMADVKPDHPAAVPFCE